MNNKNLISNIKWKKIKENRGLYLLILPAVLIFFCFTYIPIYGIIIAFKHFKPAIGIINSPWVGLKYFKQYFNSYMFSTTILNTLKISVYTILVTFPIPIIIALICNQMRNERFKKFYQVSIYLPHFISVVVMSGMIILFLSPSSGFIPAILAKLGIETGNLMGEPKVFSGIYAWSEAWQHVGWDSIMYVAALSTIPYDLYEAADVDGATKWQKMIKIDLPLLATTATILFILRVGSIMGVGFEKVYLLQNNLNISSSEIISTYLYKIGLKGSQYSFSAAIGVFNNLVNFITLIFVNSVAKKISDVSLW